MFKPFKSFKTWAGLFDGLTDLNGLNYLNPANNQPADRCFVQIMDGEVITRAANG